MFSVPASAVVSALACGATAQNDLAWSRLVKEVAQL
jgi:hypothetical protein